MKSKYIILISVVLAVIIADQWTKQLAVKYLKKPSRRCDPCVPKRTQCEQKCNGLEKQRNVSLAACQRHCYQMEKRCRHRTKAIKARCGAFVKQEVVRWRKRLKKVEGNLFCRQVLEDPTYRASYTRKVNWGYINNPACVVVKKYFHFKYQTNPGAAWGLFSQYPQSFRRPFFISITVLALAFILYLFVFQLNSSHRLMVTSLSLILGGALGNFLDRVRLDYVIDFIMWFIKNQYEWPTFNVADMAISIGVGLIAIEIFIFTEDFEQSLLQESNEEEEKEAQPTPSPSDDEEGTSQAAASASQDVAPQPEEASTQASRPPPDELPSEGAAPEATSAERTRQEPGASEEGEDTTEEPQATSETTETSAPQEESFASTTPQTGAEISVQTSQNASTDETTTAQEQEPTSGQEHTTPQDAQDAPTEPQAEKDEKGQE